MRSGRLFPAAAQFVTVHIKVMRSASSFLVCLLLFLSSLALSSSSSSSTPPNKSFRSNPYEILHVSAKDATQKEIQQQYRKLCLQHHPDKKCSGSDSEKGGVDDDFAFKEIQHAYTLIGTEKDRQHYERTKYLSSIYKNNNNMRAANRFGESSSTMFTSRPSSVHFTFGGSGMKFQFSDGSGVFNSQRKYDPFFGSDRRFSQQGQHGGDVQSLKKPHYIQKVTIPLDVLYAGDNNFELHLKTSMFYQYKAAYQGGVLAPILLQGVMTIMLTWLRSQRINWVLSLCLLAIIVHTNIPPPPTKPTYALQIKKGWKQGTKIKYKLSGDQGTPADITFIVQEGENDTYTRVGNNLHVNVKVRAKRLRRGCTLYIDPLCCNSEPIKLKLKPGEIKHDGQVVTMKGHGWPYENNDYGDLLVKVIII